MYLKANNGSITQYPYSLDTLRREYPSTSFPKAIPDALLSQYGVFPVLKLERPTLDVMTETASLASTPNLVGEVWVLDWVIHQKTQEELDRDRADASWSARKVRDQLLADTDWMALSDNTMTPEMATYRQALRDITAQAGFPYSVEWPVKPGEQ